MVAVGRGAGEPPVSAGPPPLFFATGSGSVAMMYGRRVQPRRGEDRKDVTGPMEREQEQALTDEEIVRLVLEGETDAFEGLVARHEAQVFRIVGRHVPRDRVEEVAQDVFVRAFTSLATFSGRSVFSHWLATLAVRACYGFWREAYRSREIPMSALGEEGEKRLQRTLTAQAGLSFQERASAKDDRELLHWALAKLSPENRMVLTLVHLEGRSVREAAELLGWSQINVKVRAHRARMTLRKLLLAAADKSGERGSA
jgi:RNA polymerase sigma-70 factor (ECF subfamily)